MKIACMLIAAAMPALAQQNFDFKSLDKIGANATGIHQYSSRKERYVETGYQHLWR